MALPDRTLCWVEGPPWDRSCEPVPETAPEYDYAIQQGTRADLTNMDELRAALGRLDNKQLGEVLGMCFSALDHETEAERARRLNEEMT